MSIPIEVLEKIETISTLKVLIYFYKESDDNGFIKISQKEIFEGSGVSRNSIRNALNEMEAKKLVTKVVEGKGNNSSTYQVSKVGGSKVEHQQNRGSNIGVSEVEHQGWKKSVGARKKQEAETDNNINIINNNLLKDFKEFNFINKDINSLSVVNENIYLTDEQLGKLARRVLIEWFLPLAKIKGARPNYFFPQQMKMLKDLLVKYRTEQVLASIKYWCVINPPKNGVSSVKWLTFERKGTDYVMIALDYFKQQYVANENQEVKEERKQKIEEMKTKAQEIVQKKNEEREKVKNMSDDDFLSNLLGGLGKISNGG